MDNVNHTKLFIRFIKGETDELEDQIILNWFGKEEARKTLFTHYEKEWETASNAMPLEEQDKILERIRKKTDIDYYKSSGKRIALKPLLRCASVACILILFGLGIFKYTEHIFSAKEFIIFAEEGQKATVELPDGTIVCLNSGSKLKYNASYNITERTVILEGEGYFDIRKNQRKNFIVQAGNLEIVALGTIFDVRAYAKDSLITTTLIEGKVSIKNDLDEVLLCPNEQVKYIQTTNTFSEVQACDASRYALWKNDELFFDCETLEQVSETLKRIYSIEVVFMSEQTKEHTFCGVISNRNMYNVLDFLSLTAPVKYEIKDNKIYFMERNK